MPTTRKRLRLSGSEALALEKSLIVWTDMGPQQDITLLRRNSEARRELQSQLMVSGLIEFDGSNSSNPMRLIAGTYAFRLTPGMVKHMYSIVHIVSQMGWDCRPVINRLMLKLKKVA